MSHLRQQIRDRIASNLTGLQTTGSNVFQSRAYPMEQGKLPGLIVYTIAEDTIPITSGADRTMDASLTVAVEAYAVGSNLDNLLDTICKEVQIRMANDRTINNLAIESQLESTTIDFAQENDTPAGYVKLTWMINYQFFEKTPEVAL